MRGLLVETSVAGPREGLTGSVRLDHAVENGALFDWLRAGLSAHHVEIQREGLKPDHGCAVEIRARVADRDLSVLVGSEVEGETLAAVVDKVGVE